MKKPIFDYYERHNLFIELELLKLHFKRDFEKTGLFRFLESIINRLALILNRL